MATTPKIRLRDGSGYTQSLVFSTNQEAIVIDGTIGADTADIQISVNGASFVSDPALVSLDLQTFTVPNLDTHPNGLLLGLGINTIAIRTIDIVGGVSATATVTVTRVPVISDVATILPSGIRVRRRRDAVDILVAKPVNTSLGGVASALPDNATLLGFNFYASTTPAGKTGYIKVNARPVLQPSTYEEDVYSQYTDNVRWKDPFRESLRLRVTEEDAFGNLLAERLNRVYDTSAMTGDFRFISSLNSVDITEFVYFRHFRSGGTGIINSDQFVSVSDTDPLYYVVTAVYLDLSTGQEVETAYSQEVLGTPLVIDTKIRDLPGRKQLQIVQSFMSQIVEKNTSITIIPGSTTRDVTIDPFASEAERIWFILDFVHRSQSFLTLLQVDDPRGTGTSDPYANSDYKKALAAALGFPASTAATAVQTLIDTQFDKLAANEGKRRLSGRSAVGQVVIYTPTKPTTNLVVPAGTYVTAPADASGGLSSVRYLIGGSYTMPVASADAFYNFDTKRYEIVADIMCESIGETGNRPAGSITSISGVSFVSVTNVEATVFGSDQESNADLAARCMLAYVSVDTGTEGGYTSTATEQTGVLKVKVVKSGDPLMMRDYDEVRGKHIGGKVDIWVQGLRERQVQETFAFSFDIARDVRCKIVDLGSLTFQVLDSRVTVDTPITALLNIPSQGLGVRNVTTGEDYSLAGATILDYKTFRLNSAITQPVTHADDVISADYRYRALNQFRFTLQPVRRIVSVVGEVSGTLNPTTGYALYKTDDPLLMGESTVAGDHLVINQVNDVPSGASITITDESHVLLGSTQEPLNSIGINTATIRVYNAARSVEYSGPGTVDPDFEIIAGTATTPVKVVRTQGTTIKNGETVSVDYVHDENFTVTYVINDLLQSVQQVINARRHTTADALVKQAVENPIEIETTVQLLPGASKDTVDPQIRTNLSLLLDKKVIGQNVAQSDVIAVVNDTGGVDYSPVPYAKMAYGDGARKLREPVLSSNLRLPSLDIGGNRVFILTNSLLYPTTNGGSLVTEHGGVFQDDIKLTPSGSPLVVGQHPNQAYIIGASGAEINGYTDDTTLTAAGYLNAADRAAELLRRTANHVLVSLSAADLPPDTPDNHAYTVSYVVRGDSGAHDISTSLVEYATLGDLTISYRAGS